MSILVRIAALLVAIVLISSCATPSSVNDSMQSWVGSHQSSLIASWGPPQEVADDGLGGKVLIFKQTKSMPTPGHAQTTVQGNTAYTTYTAPSDNAYVATRMFYVNKDGYIYNYKWRGM
jgi:hypothetical protein